jgi:PAS domain S-box-containing protein
MLPHASRHADPAARLESLRRIALVVAGPADETLVERLVTELAQALPVTTAFVATFADDARTRLRTLAAWFDGRRLPDFDYEVAGSPCERVVGQEFRYLASGVLADIDPASVFAEAKLDAYAAFPLNDGQGVPLGVLAVMDREPIAGGDAAHAEVMLKVVAGRLASELERRHTLDVLQRAALAVSAAQGDAVFDELVRMLATLLQLEFAFIARHDPDDPTYLKLLALHADGRIVHELRYPVATSPCRHVLGQQFRAFPSGLAHLFPDDPDVLVKGAEGYAGHPLTGHGGEALGVIAVGSRQPLRDLGRIEALLKIFAVRAAAELQRLRAVEALARSEASYRAIFDAAEDAIYVHDWDSFALLDVNPRACADHGRTREELLRADPAELTADEPPYDLEHALANLQLARLGRCEPFEWLAQTRRGRVWWEMHLKPAQIGGRPHILAFARDITERKAAEERLRASEAQYRAIFDASADALILWDSRFRRVDVNPAYEKIYGWTRDEVIGRGYEHLPYSENYALPRRELVRRALAGETCRAELQAMRKDGTPIMTEVHAIPFTHRGEPHVLAIARDITERKAAEERLRLSEEQYRAIFNVTSDALALWDSQMRRVDVNVAYERLYGWTRDEVVGRSFGLIPNSPQFAQPREALMRRALAGETCVAELEAVHKNGERILTELVTIPFRHRGEPHVLTIARDVTERRRAEAERTQLEAQLRQAQKMEAIGQLTGGIAHDFNNMLTSVLGYTVLAQERAGALGDPRLLRQIGQARLATERARDLIAQMLAFARRKPGARRPLALAPLVRQAIELLRPTLPSSVMIDVEADDAALPLVDADAVQLEQVLFNLCINARDAVGGAGRIRIGLHTAPGGWRCQSCGMLVPQGRWVELRVEDDGCGIAPDTLRRMFDPFFTTKPAGSGSGMGLAMVHGIVHDHGGHIGVRTQIGAGTAFSLLLPAGAPTAQAPAVIADLDAHRAAGARPALQGRVLLVEDDALAGGYIAEQLDAWGLAVTLQRDARDALAWLEDESHRIDLLLTDLTMPHLSGLDLARRAAALRPGLPVLLVSGDLGVIDARALAEAGVRATLAKPLDAATLRSAVTDALAAAR